MDYSLNHLTCPACGKPVAAGSSYCESCGTRVFQGPDGQLADPYLGKTIDDTFEIEDILGSGSMGVVYKARHKVLNCHVAIKVLRQDYVSDRVVLARFQREAQAASALSHQNVIRIMHYGKTYLQAPYIAMECLDGIDLSELVAKEFPLNPRRACSFIYQTVQALMVAHDAGIIHRDLKPANIVVVTQNGQEVVKVLDFGIAKIADGDAEGLTKEGSVCGTPAFMSPEQVLGKPVTPASDIFSLGSIIYYMLTCKLPFQGASMVDMATAILTTEPPPPSKARIDTYVDPHLEAICLKCLAKNVELRYQSAAEISRDLEHAYNEIPEEAPEVKTRIVVGNVDENVDLSGATCCEIQAYPDEEEDEEGATVVDMQAYQDEDDPDFDATATTKSSIGQAVSMVGQALSHALSLDSVSIGNRKLAPNESTRDIPAMPEEEILAPDASEEEIQAHEELLRKRKRQMLLIAGIVVFVCTLSVVLVALFVGDDVKPEDEKPKATVEDTQDKDDKKDDEDIHLSSVEIFRMTDAAGEAMPRAWSIGVANGLVYGAKDDDSVAGRIQAAATLVADGKKDQACEAYREILKDTSITPAQKTSVQDAIKANCEAAKTAPTKTTPAKTTSSKSSSSKSSSSKSSSSKSSSSKSSSSKSSSSKSSSKTGNKGRRIL